MNSSFPLRAFSAALALLASLSVRLQAEEAGTKWYDLEPNQKVVMEVVLKPGESKPVEVAAAAPIIVGFETDISAADNVKYAYPKPSVNLLSKESSVGGPKGASSLWQPHGGKIKLKWENKTALTLKVAIYQGPKPADWTGDPLP